MKFDLDRLETTGPEITAIDGVGRLHSGTGMANAAIAANGTLVYVPSAGIERRQVVMVDRRGQRTPLPKLPPGEYSDVRVSPEGRRLALTLRDDIWIYDVVRTTLTPLTVDPARDKSPIWSPGGERIILTSRRRGYPELMSRAADATGQDELFLTRSKDALDVRANAWVSGGKSLIIVEVGTPTVIGEIPVDPPSDSLRVLVQADSPSPVSPDGSLIAYQSSGEIFVQRYPQLGNQRQVSTSGARRPIWSHDGHELFFTSATGRQMLAAPLLPGGTFGQPEVLFDAPMLAPATGNRPYDVMEDGRFVVIVNTDATGADNTANLILVQNWFEELKRLVPRK